MLKILFTRRFRKTFGSHLRTSGTHLKVRDYFMHCLQHPQLEPYLYFSPDSEFEDSEVWTDVPRGRIVRELALDNYDALFLTGRDWKLLPKTYKGMLIINLLQSLEQCREDHWVFRYLKKPAYRICVSREILETIRQHVTTPAVVIRNGIPLELFQPAAEKPDGAILIWARKQPDLGEKLYHTLRARGREVTLLRDYIPRAQFARCLAMSDIFVCLPLAQEGFYLPALEGMASGCAVVCADAVGNREFCVHGQTCLMPLHDDCDDHLHMVEQLIVERELKEQLQQQGRTLAQAYSLDNERKQFYRFVDEFILH
ncbi:glycosyltransferase family 4 protein [candidate division KSB1 bacterium]|nr:glycosyltransferase family 4 protein [candidate division KSB1 bacterium]